MGNAVRLTESVYAKWRQLEASCVALEFIHSVIHSLEQWGVPMQNVYRIPFLAICLFSGCSQDNLQITQPLARDDASVVRVEQTLGDAPPQFFADVDSVRSWQPFLVCVLPSFPPILIYAPVDSLEDRATFDVQQE